jgi:hypothetical protein
MISDTVGQPLANLQLLLSNQAIERPLAGCVYRRVEDVEMPGIPKRASVVLRAA